MSTAINTVDQPPKCDVCDRPATTFARDAYDATGPLDMIVKYRPVDYIKKGCDEHPVASETFDCRTNFVPSLLSE